MLALLQNHWITQKFQHWNQGHRTTIALLFLQKMQETVCPRQDSLHSISLQNAWCPSGISSGTPAIYNLAPFYWKYFFHFEIQFQFYADRI